MTDMSAIEERLNKHRKDGTITCEASCECWDIEAMHRKGRARRVG